MADHNIPTVGSRIPADIKEEDSRIQVQTLEKNVVEFGVPYIPILDVRQGIVHIIGPELGLSLPGTTIVCGDSHTSTHGALGALAFGIGTSEVEHVMATQTLLQTAGEEHADRRVRHAGLRLFGEGHRAGDHRQDHHRRRQRPCHRIHRRYDPSAGHGGAVHGVSNMSIEAGARAGPDRAGPDDVRLRRRAASSRRRARRSSRRWRTGRRCRRDPGAHYDTVVRLTTAEIAPMVTWGTTPGAVVPVTGIVPNPADEAGRGQARPVAAHAGIHGV